MQASVGDRVRIDIPDETDPDHEAYHGEHGHVIERVEDDFAALYGDQADPVVYRVELDSGDVFEFQPRDLRPPFD